MSSRVTSKEFIYPAASSDQGKFNSESAISRLVNLLSNTLVELSHHEVTQDGSNYYLSLVGYVLHRGYLSRISHGVSLPQSGENQSGEDIDVSTALPVSRGSDIYYHLIRDTSNNIDPPIITQYEISTDAENGSAFSSILLGSISEDAKFIPKVYPKIFTSEVYHEMEMNGEYSLYSLKDVVDVLIKLGVLKVDTDSEVPRIPTNMELTGAYITKLVNSEYGTELDTSVPGSTKCNSAELLLGNQSSDADYMSHILVSDNILESSPTNDPINLQGFNVLSRNGTLMVDSENKRVWCAVYNDYAEWYLKSPDQVLEPGDVVVKLRGTPYYGKSESYKDPLVVGVVSDSYGMIVGGDELLHSEDNLGKYIPVGISGRVRVKVSGNVHEGDLLYSCSDGKATSSLTTSVGRILGKALSDPDSEGKVLMQIMLS